MRAIPLHQRRAPLLTILLQQPPMQMQPGIRHAMHMDRRGPQHSLLLHFIHKPKPLRNRLGANQRPTMLNLLIQLSQRRPPSQQHAKPPPHALNPTCTDPDTLPRRRGARLPRLLLQQHTAGELRALREPHQADPLAAAAGPVVVLHRQPLRVRDLLDRAVRVDVRVLGQPAQPAPEGRVGSVDGDDVGVRWAEEGSVGPDEPEGAREVFYQRAGLRGEDGGVDAAAVEAEEAGEGEGRVGWGV